MVLKPKKLEAAPAPQQANDFSAYTFYIKTIQGATIKGLCDVLKDIVHDVTLYVKPDVGLTCSCMEGSKVCIVYMILFANRLETFYCPQVERISLSLDSLSHITGMCGHSDQMSLYQEKTEPNIVTVLIETQDATMKTLFRLRLKAMDVFELAMDHTEYLSVVTMQSAFFSTLCRRLSKLHDQLTIESLEDKLKIGVDGASADGYIEIAQARDLEFNRQSSRQFKAKFALRYLLLFTKATSLSATVEMYLAQDYPLMLKYMISDIGELQLCQMPVYEDDEQDLDEIMNS